MAPKICMFWFHQGFCNKGSNCPFDHELLPEHFATGLSAAQARQKTEERDGAGKHCHRFFNELGCDSEACPFGHTVRKSELKPATAAGLAQFGQRRGPPHAGAAHGNELALVSTAGSDDRSGLLSQLQQLSLHSAGKDELKELKAELKSLKADYQEKERRAEQRRRDDKHAAELQKLKAQIKEQKKEANLQRKLDKVKSAKAQTVVVGGPGFYGHRFHPNYHCPHGVRINSRCGSCHCGHDNIVGRHCPHCCVYIG